VGDVVIAQELDDLGFVATWRVAHALRGEARRLLGKAEVRASRLGPELVVLVELGERVEAQRRVSASTVPLVGGEAEPAAASEPMRATGVAELVGVSTSAVRAATRRGALVSCGVDGRGRRLYDPAVVEMWRGRRVSAA
jgi:hypothetical protein